MEQKYVVRFAREDPETPTTMDEQIALAPKAAQKLGVPNCESKPVSELPHRRSLGLCRVDLGGASVDRDGAVQQRGMILGCDTITGRAPLRADPRFPWSAHRSGRDTF